VDYLEQRKQGKQTRLLGTVKETVDAQHKNMVAGLRGALKKATRDEAKIDAVCAEAESEANKRLLAQQMLADVRLVMAKQYADKGSKVPQ
jgi:hypothetical protein